MDIRRLITDAGDENAKDALAYFLEQYTSPAFGALPKNEIELIVLNVLERLGGIGKEPEVYELVSKLRVTRSRARNLIYDRELRKSTELDLDGKVKGLLKKPLIQKNGDLYTIEVENPLVSDHLRAKVQKLGYVSDGSFSPCIVKLGLDAISALIESYLSDEEKIKVKNALVAAGAPDTSLKGVLKATFKKVASKVASESGEALMDKASVFFGPIVDAGIDQIKAEVTGLFGEEG